MMRTKTQLFTMVILGIAMVSCGTTQTSETKKEVTKPKKTLHEATFFGDLNAVKQHIAFGTDLNERDDYGSTPLNVAITFGKEDIAKALIEGDADIALKTPDGSTPLHSAAFFGRVETVKVLIAKGADLDATNSYGVTAITNANAPFEQMWPIYDQVSKDLGPFGFKIDYDQLQKNRVEITAILEAALNTRS